MNPWEILRNLWGPTQASLLMGIAVLGARYAVESGGFGPPLQLVAGILAGVVTYPLFLWWRAPDVREDILGIARRRRQGPTNEEAAHAAS